MAEDLDLAVETSFAPQDFVLRIPGEHFFCECIDLPETLDAKDLENHVEEEMQRLSPFPLAHLQWGYHASLKHRKALVFGALNSKLRQLGWENLEIFRRVFPSFVSLLSEEFGNRYERPTISFIRHEGSLTAAAFDSDCPIPTQIYSLALSEEEMEDGTFELTRSKLLSLFDLDGHEIDSRIMRTGQAIKEKDTYRFTHLDEDFDDFEEAEESFKIDAEKLWSADVRSLAFKQSERKRRKLSGLRWSALLAAAAFVCLFSLLEVGLVFLSDKVTLVHHRNMYGQKLVAEVNHLGEVLLQLKQNDRGGIDPIRSLTTVMGLFPKKKDPHDLQNQIRAVHLTKATLPFRNELELEGEADKLEHVTLFFDNLEASEHVAKLGEHEWDPSKNQVVIKFDVKLTLKEDEAQPVAKLVSPSSQ